MCACVCEGAGKMCMCECLPVGGGRKEGVYVREKLMVHVREMGCGMCMKEGKGKGVCYKCMWEDAVPWPRSIRRLLVTQQTSAMVHVIELAHLSTLVCISASVVCVPASLVM